MRTAFERIEAALDSLDCRPKLQRDGSLRARCPAHNGETYASLSVKTRKDNDGIVVKCFGKCEVGAVLDAIGWHARELFDEPREAVAPLKDFVVDDAPRIVARYTYTDADGTIVGQVLRKEPKGFLQRRPNGRGGWEYKAGPPVLYRLPEVLAAVREGRQVYVVEGEKDADRLAAEGQAATCNAMGAGAWKPEHAEALHGAYVTVVADKDAPGVEHVRQVVESLTGVAASVTVVQAAAGKDVSDHLDAGRALDELEPVDLATASVEAGASKPAEAGYRRLKLTKASEIIVRPVEWLWALRIALGTLVLIGGREGIGKSTIAYDTAARITRGTLPGVHFGTPKSVIVAATEDSWEHTIVPRLMAAGADLERVHRVEVETSEGVGSAVSLPRDLVALEQAIRDTDTAVVLLDPLMSRLDSKLDTHKDGDVRLALEPLVAVADRSGAAVIGLIHVNKSTSSDALTLLMASRAFSAVARAVLFVMKDPEDEERRLLGQPKNNLGRTDLPTLTFRIDSAKVADTDKGPVTTGRVVWLGETQQSISEALESASQTGQSRSATAEAADWLEDWLTSKGGTDDSATIKKAGAAAGHSLDSLKRAKDRLRITHQAEGFPRRTFWSLAGTQPAPAVQSAQPSQRKPGESAPTALTAPTEPVSAVSAVGAVPARSAPTDDPWQAPGYPTLSEFAL